MFGQYDANASLNFEVIDFSFLRFGVGDLAKWNDGGTAEATPYFLVEAELSGTDGSTTTSALLSAASSSSDLYQMVRARPFSMMLYDMENVADGTVYNDNVDLLTGCFISDFTISSAINAPVMCNVNMVVREIQYRRSLASASELPDFTSTAASVLDIGNGDFAKTTSPSYGNPKATYDIASVPPLMFYGGQLKIANNVGDAATPNVLGQVTSFNFSYSNNLITYRTLGSRFIELPQLGMRRQTLSCNVVFRLPSNDATAQQGLPVSNTTSILEMIRNYLGYASTDNTPTGGAPFAATDILRPAMATTQAGSGAGVGSPQQSKPIEKYFIQLHLHGTDDESQNARGATINVRYAAIEGFGLPIQMENGLIEIPINFSVRGYPYVKVSDGSYNGHDGAGSAFTDINPILTWWV
jgi:hypothetical protein